MTAPSRRPSVEGALGNHEKRIGTLESIAPPADTNTQRPIFGFTAVQSVLTAPKIWPGAMRVVPAYGFNVAGSDSAAQEAYAKKAATHDQTAASYAAAAATLSATVDDWLIDTSIRYQCWVGVRCVSNSATANIGISSTAIGTNEISLSGSPTDNFAIYRLFSDKTFGAGETITVKAYRTANSGIVEIDQLYFFPSNVNNYYTGPTNVMLANIASIEISTFADLGPTASSVADTRFSGNAVKDTQTANDYADAESSAWSFLTAPQFENIASDQMYDDELRIFRHNYVTGCYESSTDSEFNPECFISLAGDGIPQASARVYLPSAGLYYLGPSTPYGAPPQLKLWRNAATPSSSVPYQTDATAVTTDVRVGEYFAISSYLDDYY